MAFVVYVETVVDRLTLHVGDESCNVDHCHAIRTLPSTTVQTAKNQPPLSADESESVLALFDRICERTREAVSANQDWNGSGLRAGQYNIDLEVDALCVDPLLAAGFDVLSEESGLQHTAVGVSRGTVVVDPLDGSTNATLGLPWFATSLCLVVEGAPAVSAVVNLATGEWFHAVAGRGATSSTGVLSVSPIADLGDGVVAVSGLPAHHFGWGQFRAMGASALDICAVARGSFCAFADLSFDAHGVWDYAGGMLVVQEAGGVIVDALGRDLIVLDHHARRTPVAAASRALLDALMIQRDRGG
jgi:myo-inositol-1(or 4)-monophosphatase